MITLIKYPEELRTYCFDFTDQVEIVAGETLASGAAVSYTKLVGNGNIVIGTPTIVSPKVLFTISGGSLHDRYELIGTVQTSGGSILAAVGQLKIDRV